MLQNLQKNSFHISLHLKENLKGKYLSSEKKKKNRITDINVFSWKCAKLILLGSHFLLQCNISCRTPRYSCIDEIVGLLLSVYYTSCRNLCFRENLSRWFPFTLSCYFDQWSSAKDFVVHVGVLHSMGFLSALFYESKISILVHEERTLQPWKTYFLYVWY